MALSPVQRFVINNITAPPNRDYNFSYKLVRVNSERYPVKRIIRIYDIIKYLPNSTSFFNVFVIGNISPTLLNLFKQERHWFKDVWINCKEDMNQRKNIIIRLYDTYGNIYPRELTYYNFIDENSILIAQEIKDPISSSFISSNCDIHDYKYLNVYSNTLYRTHSSIYNYGVRVNGRMIFSSNDLNIINSEINNHISNASGRGLACVYVNGYFRGLSADSNIPIGSYVEYVYDESYVSSEYFSISSLRQFMSERDNKLKYLIFREPLVTSVQFYDDNEFYIYDGNIQPNIPASFHKGLYYYQHKPYSARNVTDKDYSLFTSYVQNQVQRLNQISSNNPNTKYIVLFTRLNDPDRILHYNSTRLHELYKLPYQVELDVLSNTINTIEELRAEKLENSFYFDVVDLEHSNGDIRGVDEETAAKALGYNGITYYLANHIIHTNQPNVEVPIAYRSNSTAFEYDQNGILLGYYTTQGPTYNFNNPNARAVEFIYGTMPADFGSYLPHQFSITPSHDEFLVLSANFNNHQRTSDWEDITFSNKVNYDETTNTLTVNETSGKKVKIVYLNNLHIIDLNVDISQDGIMYFPLYIYEDRGTNFSNHLLDVPYLNIEIFLNGRKLVYGLDWFMDFPYVSICNKEYITYSNITQQRIIIRMNGFTLNKDEINLHHIRGFVIHGALSRNKRYDIRDDRLFSIFIKGRLYPRSNVYFAEDDQTVRINDPLNGMPYTMSEPFIPLKGLTKIHTFKKLNFRLSQPRSLYEHYMETNKRISNLYDLIFKEPELNDTMVIPQRHYLFSPITSKFIHDILDGNIPSSLYDNYYDESIILNMINSNDTYRRLYMLDPIRYDLDEDLVTIHPHMGNTYVQLTLNQYKFINTLIKLITNNRPHLINTSGYIQVV